MTRNVITTEHELYFNLKFKNHSLENHKQYLKRSWRKLLDWHITVHPPDLNKHFKHNIILIFDVEPLKFDRPLLKLHYLR